MTINTNLFPVTLETQWQAADKFLAGLPKDKTLVQQGLNPRLIDWLLDPSSLTARLKSCCSEFRVEVLGQKIEKCNALEANEDIAFGEQVLVREVVLFCDNKPQVFARSLLPLNSLSGAEQQLAELGQQPLGQVLFNDPHLVRKCIEVAHFEQTSHLAQLVNALGMRQEHILWGRRSVFILKNKPIMVAEVFLPNSYAYQ